MKTLLHYNVKQRELKKDFFAPKSHVFFDAASCWRHLSTTLTRFLFAKALSPPRISARNSEISVIFHSFLGGDTNLPFRQKMRKICVNNMRQVFRNISEMCVGKFRNFRWQFYVSTENIPNRENFNEKYENLC